MSDHDEPSLERGDQLDPIGSVGFEAPAEWWRRLVAGLDASGLEQLVRGELRYMALADDGVASVPLVAPGWLLVELAAR